MPSTQRRPVTSVIRHLQEAPNEFEFFQAVRLLARHLRDDESETDDTIGERVRFGNSLNIAFAPSEIEKIDFAYNAETPQPDAGWDSSCPIPDAEDIVSAQLIPSFIGLTGNHGTLPRCYTEDLLARELFGRDKTARAFLDIFTNRAITLYFQAWEKYRLHLHYEKNRDDLFLPMLLALLGLDGRALTKTVCATDQPVLAETLVYYGGALRQSAHPPHLIARILEDHFKVPVNILQFVGRWYALPPEQISRLGMANMSLGLDVVCGDRMWQCQTGITLEVGPLDRADFERFLPGQEASAALADMLFMLAGVTLDCSVNLILKKEHVVPASLGGSGNAARLGYTTWMVTHTPEEDCREVSYEIVPRCVETV